MFSWFKQSFEEHSILWLFISAVLGGLISALFKFIFEVIFPQRLQNKRNTRLLIDKYSNPVIRSSYDLQSRLYNILKKSFLTTYYFTTQTDKTYAVENTLYVLSEYFGWIEILRKEVQYLDMGSLKKSQKLQKLLDKTAREFSTDKYGINSVGEVFRIFHGDQRAIGEIMIDKSNNLTCIGYAEFSLRLKTNSQFSQWFAKLERDIGLIANKQYCFCRLVAVQNSLIDIIDHLDKDKKHITQNKQKITGYPCKQCYSLPKTPNSLPVTPVA